MFSCGVFEKSFFVKIAIKIIIIKSTCGVRTRAFSLMKELGGHESNVSPYHCTIDFGRLFILSEDYLKTKFIKIKFIVVFR